MEEWAELLFGFSGSGVVIGMIAGIVLARNGRRVLRAGIRGYWAARHGFSQLAELTREESAQIEAEAPLSEAPHRSTRRRGARAPAESPIEERLAHEAMPEAPVMGGALTKFPASGPG